MQAVAAVNDVQVVVPTAQAVQRPSVPVVDGPKYPKVVPADKQLVAVEAEAHTLAPVPQVEQLPPVHQYPAKFEVGYHEFEQVAAPVVHATQNPFIIT